MPMGAIIVRSSLKRRETKRMTALTGSSYGLVRTTAWDAPTSGSGWQIGPGGQPGKVSSVAPDKTPAGHAIASLQALAAGAGLIAWAHSVPGGEGLLVRFVDPETGGSVQRVLADTSAATMQELRTNIQSQFDGWA